eukprot:CAMPEP_0117018568 /NCGR_PEP_ID=MMETSP0472-20121206/14346_1 /TAXON_ID=693140 ORGANISM="Tiarina fusus, Strain LIS" /NCGR_SAMPLE_ID=MMETSP0472 /ASSEMBLY_ACC=CAM_ASM_000603 /LENGTH=225 /DNA_ID=CAMNT_0004723263 /DNA_START=57 /DNA_END=734 /DNA_ORIENTATION=+
MTFLTLSRSTDCRSIIPTSTLQQAAVKRSRRGERVGAGEQRSRSPCGRITPPSVMMILASKKTCFGSKARDHEDELDDDFSVTSATCRSISFRSGNHEDDDDNHGVVNDTNDCCWLGASCSAALLEQDQGTFAPQATTTSNPTYRDGDFVQDCFVPIRAESKRNSLSSSSIGITKRELLLDNVDQMFQDFMLQVSVEEGYSDDNDDDEEEAPENDDTLRFVASWD